MANEEISGQTPPKMSVKFFTPFVDGVIYAMKVQCSTVVKSQKLHIKKYGDVYPTDILAMIGLVSPSFHGSLVLCFPKQTFLNLMEKMLGEKFAEITKDFEDGAEELLNIIFGQAKIKLNELGFGLEKAIPTVIRGNGLEVSHMSPSPTLIIEFDSDAGKFHLEMGMNVFARP